MMSDMYERTNPFTDLYIKIFFFFYFAVYGFLRVSFSCILYTDYQNKSN